ncbi:hypothetical protein [Streptomyces sp. NPDC089799]|uniref:hypothetical protein n=1 Tax=Streptomyces sp. NPDC089799 TaxID=3155066 RepID=UPI00342830C4
MQIGYRLIIPVSLLALAAALGLSGLGLVWVTIAVSCLVGIPEITAVIVDNVFNEAVPSHHRASLLSVIAFVEFVITGIGCLVLGALMDGLGSGAVISAHAAVPLPACLLRLPVPFRRARVTTGTEDEAGRRP